MSAGSSKQNNKEKFECSTNNMILGLLLLLVLVVIIYYVFTQCNVKSIAGMTTDSSSASKFLLTATPNMY